MAPPYDAFNANLSKIITIADEKGKLVRTLQVDEPVADLVVAPDGRHVFVGSSVNYWLDAETGEMIFQHTDNDIRAVGFPPDGKRFALAYYGESQLRFFDAVTGHQVDSIPCDPEAMEPWIQFSADGKRIAMSYENSAESDYGVVIHDLATRELIQRIKGEAEPVKAAYFSPDGRRLFTRSSDASLRVWDVENGYELMSLHDGGNFAPWRVLPGRALSPDGRMVAIAGPQGVFLKQAAAPEQVAAWQRPPVLPHADSQWWKRLGGVQDWLVLAPIYLRQQDDLADALDNRQLKDEADIDPIAGTSIQIGNEESVWRQVPTSDCVLDFQKVTSPNEDHCLAYAVTHIYSDAPRERVRLLVGTDDLAKIYLNGKLIYEFHNDRPCIPADDEVLIDLRKGKNVLVCKVIDAMGDWGLSAQIVGADYQPIPGVTTGTTP
jgi:hypothetical protein